MLKLQIILGSTREGRALDHLTPWLLDRARQHGKLDLEVLDLRDWPLPFFAETFATIGDRANPTYSQPIVQKWNRKVAEADAFLFVTPEYNHSIPGVLKNALDNVFVSFAMRHKPAGFIGYGGAAAGARGVEQLVSMCFEMELVPLRNTVLFSQVANAFEAGAPKNPMHAAALAILLDDLAWWAELMKPARATQLLPGGIRLRNAMPK